MFLFDLMFRPVKWFFFSERPSMRWFSVGLVRFVVLVELPVLAIIGDIRWGFFEPYATFIYRLMVLYFLGLSSAFVAGVAYLKDIYGVDSHRLPFWHLISSFFGIAVPRIDVSNRLKDAAGKEMVEIIGGPAHLNIESGYAVFTEKLAAPGEIYGPGKKFITRHERVQEFVDLHEQEGGPVVVSATTRDGISVTAENIRFLFRLWDRQWETETTRPTKTVNPYPYSKDAIYDFVYKRSVMTDSTGAQKPFVWPDTVAGKVKGIIKDYISDNRLEDVIASRETDEQAHPRVRIRNSAYTTDFKKSMQQIGTFLRWWDPGEFKSLKPVEEQFLSNWSVEIDNHVELNKAEGEAKKQAYEELGRAEAEAELLMSIINSLRGIELASDKPHALQNLILMRTAQVIRALNTPAPNGHSKDSDDKDKKKHDER